MFGLKKKKKGDKPEEQEAGAEDDAKATGKGGKGAKDVRDDEDGEEGGEGDGAAEAAPKSKKKLIMAVVAVVVLAGVGAGLYFSGILSKKKEETALLIGADGKVVEKPIFYTLPDFLVNLNSQGKTAAFLKAQVIIEVAHQADIPIIEANLPRVSDAFTTYLRELRPSDLSGSTGIQRLREELMLRVNKVLEPVEINDVLFKEILVQ